MEENETMEKEDIDSSNRIEIHEVDSGYIVVWLSSTEVFTDVDEMLGEIRRVLTE